MKGRRTETERMGGKGGEVNGKEGCGEGGGGGGGWGVGGREERVWEERCGEGGGVGGTEERNC